MNLLVFVFLVIGMLGIYTQVAAIEAARLFASQTGIANTMLAWHFAGSSMAANVVNIPTVPTTGCSLSASFVGTFPSGFPLCPKNPAFTGNPSSFATITGNSTYTLAGQTFPQLSKDYKSAIYEWKSVVYRTVDGSGNTTGYYLVTFVEPPTISASNPAPGNIKTLTTQLRIGSSDLFNQLRHTDLPLYAYGVARTVGGQKKLDLPPLIAMDGAPPAPVEVPMSYNLPSAIPDGSIAIISSPAQ